MSATPNPTPGFTSGTNFQGDPDADEDRDGLSRLIEHALGSSDQDASQGPALLSAERVGDKLW